MLKKIIIFPSIIWKKLDLLPLTKGKFLSLASSKSKSSIIYIVSVYVCLCFFLWCFSGTLIGLKLIMWLASQLGQPQGSDLPLLFYCFHLFNQSDKLYKQAEVSWASFSEVTFLSSFRAFMSSKKMTKIYQQAELSWVKLKKAPMAWFGLAFKQNSSALSNKKL